MSDDVEVMNESEYTAMMVKYQGKQIMGRNIDFTLPAVLERRIERLEVDANRGKVYQDDLEAEKKKDADAYAEEVAQDVKDYKENNSWWVKLLAWNARGRTPYVSQVAEEPSDTTKRYQALVDAQNLIETGKRKIESIPAILQEQFLKLVELSEQRQKHETTIEGYLSRRTELTEEIHSREYIQKGFLTYGEMTGEKKEEFKSEFFELTPYTIVPDFEKKGVRDRILELNGNSLQKAKTGLFDLDVDLGEAKDLLASVISEGEELFAGYKTMQELYLPALEVLEITKRQYERVDVKAKTVSGLDGLARILEQGGSVIDALREADEISDGQVTEATITAQAALETANFILEEQPQRKELPPALEEK